VFGFRGADAVGDERVPFVLSQAGKAARFGFSRLGYEEVHIPR
jgi:hypothetical protein